jgi:hypothetical protein
MRETYSGKLNGPKDDKEIFVFGSNPEGRHGKGAAVTAWRKYGAKMGKGSGWHGQSYGIITKDLRKKKHPSISVDSITKQISKLYDVARKYPDYKFMVAYHGSKRNLNGYSPNEMAEMFRQPPIPSNIIFEETFDKLVYQD